MKVSFTGLFLQHAELVVDYTEAVCLNCPNAIRNAKERLFYNVEVWTSILGCEFGAAFKEHVCLIKELVDASFLCHCKTEQGSCDYARKISEIISCLCENGRKLVCYFAQIFCKCESEICGRWEKHLEFTECYITYLAKNKSLFEREYNIKKFCSLSHAFDFGEYLDGQYCF